MEENYLSQANLEAIKETLQLEILKRGINAPIIDICETISEKTSKHYLKFETLWKVIIFRFGYLLFFHIKHLMVVATVSICLIFGLMCLTNTNLGYLTVSFNFKQN